MTNRINFSKMHGAGNDYIYVDATRFPVAHPAEAAVRWSAPHTGIGADGLVLIAPSENADFRMRIFNADGSEAGMCGNASRCIGKFVYEKGLIRKTEVTLETLSGIKTLRLHTDGTGTVHTVTVDMGEPQLTEHDRFLLSEDIPGGDFGAVLGQSLFVGMGNPHLVSFVSDLSQIDLPAVGPLVERHPRFPGRVNAEFARLLPDGSIRMRVWERGSGITQACGTGACATLVAAVLTGRAARVAQVVMDGGTLTIEWNEADNRVYMTGPATHVFDGTITYEE